MTMIEDIEELTVPADDPGALMNRASVRYVSTKRQPKKRQALNESITEGDQKEATEEQKTATNEHFLPGKQTIFVKTWGCSHNNSDSEYMAGLLASHGYSLILSDAQKDNADLWLLNSCTVKNPSEQTFVNEIKRGMNAGKRIIVAGCVPQAQPSNDQWSTLSMIGVQQIDRVVEVVEETLKGNAVRILGTKRSENDRKKKAGGAQLDLPKIRKNPFVEIIPINTGCLNQCTYCKTKHARGDLGSYPPQEIIGRVKSVLDEGISEIWLTSEDTGAYGRDIDERLPNLLKGIVQVLEEAHENDKKEVMLRIGMTNPPYILEDLEEIAEVLNHHRVFKFIHIPVQSGSDRVLDDMRRQYTAADFRHVVEFLRERVPGITIATDLICGFPTEAQEDHEDSVQLVKDLKFPILHISQFYPRPGTPAARMQRLPTNIVKERSREITKLFESYMPYDHMLGEVQRVWITDEIGGQVEEKTVPAGEDDYESTKDARFNDCWVAHNIYYHQVLIPKQQIKNALADSETWAEQESLLGCCCDVKIFQSGKHYMVGKLESPESLKFTNDTAVTSTILLHRTGRNNRKVTAKIALPTASNTEEKSADDRAKLIDVLPTNIPDQPKEPAPEPKVDPSVYIAFLAFLMLTVLHILSVPAVVQVMGLDIAQHGGILNYVYVDGLAPVLGRPVVQLVLWLLTGMAMSRLMQVPAN